MVIALQIVTAVFLHFFGPTRPPAVPEAAARRQVMSDACYSLRVGLFGTLSSTFPTEKLPLVVHFDRREYALLPQLRLLSPTVNIETPNYGSWNPVGADSVRFGWTTGWATLDIRARVTPDSIVGVAFMSDQFDTASGVTGVRTPCPHSLQ